jgi:hypothetical protein
MTGKAPPKADVSYRTNPVTLIRVRLTPEAAAKHDLIVSLDNYLRECPGESSELAALSERLRVEFGVRWPKEFGLLFE